MPDMRLFGALSLIGFSLVACGDGGASTESLPDMGARVDASTAPALGADTLGGACTGACGADDDRKCSTSTGDCPLCLVDLASATLTYCTQDCTVAPCPTGWTCEPIKAFGQDAVERACVADPAVCGDGVLQLGETCDGDDVQLGRCVDCMGYEAVCGDGVVQAGEACDGDDPQLGRCVDCMGYEAVCGDGVVQTGEACDGDTPAGYCIECMRVEAPRLDFLSVLRSRTQITFQEDRNGSTVYGFELERDPAPISLPNDGDMSGCGRAEVIESNAELTRLSFSLCHQVGWGRATWTIGVPRSMATVDLSGSLPEAYRPRHVVEAIDGSYQLEFGVDDASEVQVRIFATDSPAFVRGSIRVRMSRDDPRSSFRDAQAELEATFELLHPPLP